MPTLEIKKAYIVRGQQGPDYVQYVCTNAAGKQVKVESLELRGSAESVLREAGLEECELQSFWDLERTRAENEKLGRTKFRMPGMYPEIVKL